MIKRAIAMILCIAMVFSMVVTASADTTTGVLSLSSDSITASDETQTVVMTVTFNPALQGTMIEGTLIKPAGWTLSTATFNDEETNISIGTNGEYFTWQRSIAGNGEISHIDLTMVVPANVAPGKYTVGIHELSIGDASNNYPVDYEEYSTTITVTAPVTTHTVTWSVAGVDTTATLNDGDIPAYGSTPEKASTEEFNYTFAGWNDGTNTYGPSDPLPAVTADVTYTAVFSAETRQYTVTFVNDDGTTLDTQSVAYGTTPVYGGETPVKAEDDEYTYEFSGWTPELAAVTAEATYTAVYTSTPKLPVFSVDLGESGPYPWVHSSTTALEGTDVPKTVPEGGYYYSTNKGVGKSSSTMTITVNPTEDGYFAFDYISSGEGNWDPLTITVDGTENKIRSNSSSTASGIDWTTYRVDCTAGTQILITLTYSKDSGTDKGSDRAYVSNILYKGASDFAINSLSVTIPDGITASVDVAGTSSVLQSSVPVTVKESQSVTITYSGTGFILPGLYEGDTLLDTTGTYTYVSDTEGARALEIRETYHAIDGYSAPEGLTIMTESVYPWQLTTLDNETVLANSNQQKDSETFSNVAIIAEKAGTISMLRKVASYDWSAYCGLVYNIGSPILRSEDFSAASSNYGEAFCGDHASEWEPFTINVSAGDTVFLAYRSYVSWWETYTDTAWIKDITFTEGVPHIVAVAKESNEQLSTISVTGVTEGVAEFNALVTIKAVPDDGAIFDGWYDVVDGGENTLITKELVYSFHALEDRNIVAVFHAKNTYDLTVNTDHVSATYAVNGNEPATLTSGTAVAITEADTLTLTASAEEGYQFRGWFNEGVRVSADPTYTVDYVNASITLVAEAIPAASDDPIAAIGSLRFDSLEDAFSYAVTGDTVVLLKDYTQTADITIPAGVTLLIPCGVDDEGNIEYYNEIKNTKSLFRTLTIDTGVTITVNGTLLVNGKSACYANNWGHGALAGDYGKMVLNGSMTVNGSGSLIARGLITGTGAITTESGANIWQSLEITDWRGGSHVSAQYRNVFTFNVFYFQRIQVDTTYVYGSKLNAYVYIYVPSFSSAAELPAEGVIGYDANAFIQLTEGSSVTMKYQPSDAKTIVDVSGTVSFNDFTVNYSSYTLSTSVGQVPLSGAFDINVRNNAVVNLTKSFKILPGSTLTIDEGATVNVTDSGSLYLYDNADYLGAYGYPDKTISNTYRRLPSTSDAPGTVYTENSDGTVLVNGTLNVSGAVYSSSGAGADSSSIKTNGTTGKIVIGKSGYPLSDVTIKENKGTSKTTVDASFASFRGKMADTGTWDKFETGIYYAVGDSWVKDFTLSYNANVGETGDVVTVPETASYSFDGTGSFTVAEAPERSGYRFLGWNTAADGTVTDYAVGQNVPVTTALGAGITLYAQWQKQWTVTIESDENVTLVVKSGDTIVNSGDALDEGTELSVTWNVAMGYELDTVPETSYTVTDDLTISATTKARSYTVTVRTLEGGNDPTYVGDNKLGYGETLTVTEGGAKEGYAFIGWYEPNGKLLTKDASYDFYVTSNFVMEAWYEESATVTFMANNKVAKVWTGSTISDSDFPSVDSLLTLNGFEFDHWEKTADQVNEELQGGGNVEVKAVFRKAINTFTVTVFDGVETTTTEYTESTEIKLAAQNVDGKSFECWKTDDGIVISGNVTGTYWATETVTIRAYYTDEPIQEPMGTASITKSSYSSSTKKATFVARLVVPTGGVIVKAGLVAAPSGSYSGELTADNAQYVKNSAVAVGTSAPVNYTWNKSSVNVGDTWHVRAYLVYTYNGNTRVIYGDLVELTAK